MNAWRVVLAVFFGLCSIMAAYAGGMTSSNLGKSFAGFIVSVVLMFVAIIFAQEDGWIRGLR